MTPTWLDEVEPATEPPFVRMGTRGLRGRPWLLGGDDLAAQRAEKARLLAEHHHEVVAEPPGTRAAAGELLTLVEDHLPPGSDAADPGAPGPAVPDAEAPHAGVAGVGGPLERAARLVGEDLCLLVDDGAGGWPLVAGVLCFPSHWRLRDKLGLPLAAVHGPVPDYAAELADRVDRFLTRLRPGLANGVRRRNWTVHHEPDLHAPDVPPPPDPPIAAAEAGTRLWFRSERQTLVRLPRTGAVAFTIRTQQVPLGELATRPDLCRRLAAAVAAWPPHQVAYRGGEAVRAPLLAWLSASG